MKEALQDKIDQARSILKRVKCPHCERTFDSRGFTSHLQSCIKKKEAEKASATYPCKFCGKTFSTSRARNGHQIGCAKNPSAKDRATKISQTMKGQEKSDEFKHKLSDSMIKVHEEKRAAKEKGATIVKKVKIGTGAEILNLVFSDEI